MIIRMSTLLARTLRDAPADAVTDSHRLLVRAAHVRRVASGVWSWLPLGKSVLDNVTRIVREEMAAIGDQEVLLPALAPVAAYEASGRADDYGDLLFRLADRRGARFVLGPTHEELFADLARDQLVSGRQLPLGLFQVQTKYRDEARPRSGVLRSREFLMKDAYTFDADEAGLRASYAAHREAYIRVFARLGLAARPVAALSGPMGGSESEEFLAPAAAGEDRYAECGSCGLAANTETVVGEDAGLAEKEAVGERPCPRCGAAALRIGRAIEVGHIFRLGTKYSDLIGLEVAGADGRPVRVQMGCYGIGISRAVAALAEQTCDSAGLCWPDAVAPAAVHLVAAGGGERARAAEELAGRLDRAGVRVLLDDRPGLGTGARLADAELIGVPRIAVVGRRAAEGVAELRDRRTGVSADAAFDALPGLVGAADANTRQSEVG
ncbi:hypothetical protein BIV57_21905 [Mangrovactinospora gilvigrisea]|uniref:Proline--tRNA ligase n=1 Tax=Mangrovactinospora gilvigrisea TaxID=1428644 RepID=A0A1J7BPL0_9ACTN|nr:aminoacyl--tRNA ligase-related protein [Mangrovactinospora gilvigrisea]OIV35385.1 hypothetical protein BIV57_21905 [Mangrovactinospora gilvigrisea]